MTHQLQYQTPCCTVEKFAEMTGLSVGSINSKIDRGQIPVLKMNLDPMKRERRLINLVKLYQLADAAEYLHPGMDEA